MKNFDEARAERAERDRSFAIGGETFTYRASVAPEALLAWNEAAGGEVEVGEREWLKLFDETISAFLEPGQDEKWAEVRAPERDDPISIEDMTELVRWLFSETTHRPTGQSSGSSDSADDSGTSSKESSSSLAAVG